jgi:hypothetical protein
MAYRRGQLPTLVRYENALAHFNKVTPIRGRHEDVRPLGLRRRDEAVIRKRGDDIECVLYGTPVLTYKPDDTIVVATHGYDTVLTASFISEVLRGLGMYATPRDNSVVLGVYNTAEDKRLEYRVFDGLTIDTKPLRPVVVNPIAVTYHLVDREGMKRVKEKYKPFIQYVRMMNKVCEMLNVEDVQEIGRREFDFFLSQVEQACQADDPEQMLGLYKRMAVTRMARRMVIFNRGGFTTNPAGMAVAPREIENLWDTIIKTVHSDEVFKVVEAPLGVVRRDNNSRYI